MTTADDIIEYLMKFHNDTYNEEQYKTIHFIFKHTEFELFKEWLHNKLEE